MSILVTGAAGFIGCNCVLALNKAGFNDIIAVDNLTRAEKFLNLAQGHITDYFDKNDFIERVRKGTAPIPEAVVHMGACSDTMETDGRYIMENNYRYTLDLFAWAQKLKIPFVNASSAATYGASTVFTEDLKNEGPLNCYGYSKFLFDQVLRARMANLSAPTVNLRFFNVYGPHEQHKGRMASVAFHQYFQFKKDGSLKGASVTATAARCATSCMWRMSSASCGTSSPRAFPASLTAAQAVRSPLTTLPLPS